MKKKEKIEQVITDNNSSSVYHRNEEALNIASREDGIHLAPDGIQWKMCVNKKRTGRYPKQEVHCFTYAKKFLKSESVLSI